MSTEQTSSSAELTEQDYANAMNTIGQSLMTSLSQAIQSLPANLRSYDVLSQSLAAFTANVVYQQSPQDKQQREILLKRINEIAAIHLSNFPGA